MKYPIGAKVSVKSLPEGTEEEVAIGDVATIVFVDEYDDFLTYKLLSTGWSGWWFSEDNLESHLNNREDVIEEIQKTQSKLDELHTLLQTFE